MYDYKLSLHDLNQMRKAIDVVNRSGIENMDKRLENIENLLKAQHEQKYLSTKINIKLSKDFDEVEFRKGISDAFTQFCLENIETRNLKYLNKAVVESVGEINRNIEEKYGVKDFYSVEEANLILDEYGLLYDPSKK